LEKKGQSLSTAEKFRKNSREREREREENLSVEEAISLGKFYEPTVLLAGQCLF
jgi:hypothetical protein